MSADTQIKRIGSRSWPDIQSAWLPCVTSLSITPPGAPPSDRLADNYSLEAAFKQVPQNGEQRLAALQGVNAAMLHEGIYLLHTAANVLVAAQSHVAKGLPTWSVPTAYQAAFFSMEAMLLILGVGIIEIENRAMLVDIWPSIEARASKKAKSNYVIGSEIHLLNVYNVQHYHRWALLKRVLRMLSNSPISGAFVNAIEDVDDKDFARQRNHLHYRTTWTFDDLHAFYSDITYCRYKPNQSVLAYLDPADQGFSIALAYTVFANTVSLLSSLGNLAPVIACEIDLLQTACDFDRMPLRASYEAAMAAPVF